SRRPGGGPGEGHRATRRVTGEPTAPDPGTGESPSRPRVTPPLVPAGRHVPEVRDRVVDRLRAGRPVAQRELPVADLAAGYVLLHVVPVAEHVLVLDLGALEARERDRPVGRVNARHRRRRRVPLRIAAVEPVEEAGD